MQDQINICGSAQMDKVYILGSKVFRPEDHVHTALEAASVGTAKSGV